jgi:hypothetical protein
MKLRAPDLGFRQLIARQSAEAKTEEDVDQVLGMIEKAVNEAAREDAHEEAADVMAAIDAWASLASYVVWRFYSPRSPRDDEAGLSEKTARRLRNLSMAFRRTLDAIKIDIGATGFTVSVGIPWGVSIGVTW